ncbi:hypothetical protein O181_019856 [Austropuccinia psidii MF-1]|uniref:Trehalose-phosphatase n=1 Tax=Austropuccinia psidii MF-1 TaxID=1389203 RepID=A0A9Q3CCE7_9BASI|nr:hypothetical protein [Austropuccinia psidii MF-1]
MTTNRKGKALIFTDFNGVLFRKLKKGQRATAPSTARIRKKLRALTQNRRNIVFVASSKESKILNELLGRVPDLGIAAEHGMETKYPNAKRFAYRVKPGKVKGVLNKIDSLIIKTQNFKPGKKFTYSANYSYRKEDANTIKTLIENLNDQISSDKAYKVGTSGFHIKDDRTNPEKYQIKVMMDLKGKEKVVQEVLGENKEYVFGLSIGDKAADEGMHQVMKQNGYLSVCVSPTAGASREKVKTSANYVLRNTREVGMLLDSLAKVSTQFVTNA